MKLSALIDQLTKFNATFGDATIAIQTQDVRSSFNHKYFTVTNVEYRTVTSRAYPTGESEDLPLIVLRTGSVKDK